MAAMIITGTPISNNKVIRILIFANQSLQQTAGVRFFLLLLLSGPLAAEFGVSRRLRTMKGIAVLLLAASCACCFAVDDTNVLAAGDWSKPVGDFVGYTLRGRLILCDSPKNGDAAIYVELQECSRAAGVDMDVYCNMNPTVALGGHPDAQGRERIEKAAAVWEMRDASDKPVPESPGGFGGGAPGASWISLPCDSTVRLRASVYGGGRLKDGSLSIFFLSNHWVIPPRSTNDYYLSCTFSVDPPTNHAALPEHHVWQGTLTLPKMKIPVQRP
jgi:hypothetical protein